ncbi:DMT family transporter [Peribacillus muralis]|uniref:DMT family transporter n=1 Tax=Peribacillus muralis TaxID=264697 RepID=UPI001F4ED36F|nr:DMT family transporter [Peribacillus muralis]MCK1994104.1 DMT family transporter [Peribacillus muralis]MCK2014659.1 DMT family transporter [Peribacillus muralis]
MKTSTTTLFLILANLFWAGNYVFGKYVVLELPPIQLTFMRWLIALFLLFPLAHWIEKPSWKSVWQAWKLLLVLGLLGIIGYNFFLYWALTYTSSMNAALVNSMNPALIALVSALLLKEKISSHHAIGLIISLCGVLLVLTKGHILEIFQLQFNKGDLLMLLAILVWTLYSIIARKLKNIPVISATAVSAFLGLVLVAPFAVGSGLNIHLSGRALEGLLYIGIFPSVGSFIFWNISLRHIKASQAGVFLNLIAVFTAILSLIVGQSITTVQILGGLLVFIGVYLTSKKKTSSRPVTKTI